MTEEPNVPLTNAEKKERLRTQKREYMRRYIAANREKARASNRASYQRNRDTQLAKKKEWRDQHPGYFKQVNADYYQRNLEQARASRKAYREANRDKIRLVIAKWFKEHPEKVRAYRLANKEVMAGRGRMKRTGCSPEQYLELFAAQNGLCAICQRPPGRLVLQADHCHAKNLVRGLLCGPCNRAIGLFRDDIALLEAAIAYLKK